MTKLRITVTKEILEKSKNCRPEFAFAVHNCAIALAVRDIFPTAEVNYDFIGIEGLETIPLPEAAIDFIEKFDDANSLEREKMDPISFEIEIPDSVINQINIDELKPLLENHPTLQLV